jgi:hypothetical protein
MSHAQYDPTPKAPPPWAQPAPAQRPGTARLLPVLGVVLGLLGLGMGAAAWFRAAPPDVVRDGPYTEQQESDAKAAVCEAYIKGIRSIRTVASKRADNPADALAVAVNSRVGEVAVSMYFSNTLEENPASPGELRTLVQDLANDYQDLVLIQLADGTPADWKSIKDTIEDAAVKLDQICQ